MQHEGIGLPAQVANDELDPVRHQAADEVNIARESIELRNQDGRLALRAVLRAAASFGRRSRASEPEPVSTSSNVSVIVMPSFHEPFSHATEVDGWVFITRRSVRCTLASAVDKSSIGLVLCNSVPEHPHACCARRPWANPSVSIEPGGLTLHNFNCGDYYAYFDRSSTPIPT